MQAEAKAKADVERQQAQALAQAKIQAEAKAKVEAETQQAQALALAKAQTEARAKAEADAQQVQAVAMAKTQAEAKAKADVERQQAQALAQAKIQAEAKAKVEAEAQRAQALALAKVQAEAKAKAEADAQQVQALAMAKTQAEAKAKAKADAEAQQAQVLALAKAQADVKAKADTEAQQAQALAMRKIQAEAKTKADAEAQQAQISAMAGTKAMPAQSVAPTAASAMSAAQATATAADAQPKTGPVLDLRLKKNADTTTASSYDASSLSSGQAAAVGTGAELFSRWLNDGSDMGNFGSPISEADLKLILYRAVRAAAERSPQVRQKHADWDAARADVDESKGQRWPQLDVGTQSSAAHFGGNSEGTPNSTAVVVGVTTNVFDWGRLGKVIGSREQLAIATQQAYEAELTKNAYDVSANVVELVKNRLITEISQRYVDRMGGLVSMLRQIVDVDRGRASELTQSKAKLLQAESTRDATAAKVRDYTLNLRKLVGDEPIAESLDRDWQLQVPNLDLVLAEVPMHPSLQQAEAETQAAKLNVDAIRAGSKPQLNWVINKTTARDALNREQPWQTYLSFNWGAFRGGSTKAAEKAAYERAMSSSEKKAQQQLDLEFAVRAAGQDANTFLSRADLYKDLTAETDRVRKAFFEQWYHLGKRTLLDVLSAESDHYGNRVNEITSRFDGYSAIFREYNNAGALVNWMKPPGEVAVAR
ncbi:MAG: TolC family protein [Collimonas sp.]|uniref:TolC family protein n=1 Tax=Collimonas sp. TaxID=1963772 RepID=UPI003263967A